MKLTFVFCMCALLHVTAATYGQNITLKVKNVSFEQLLEDLGHQSGYHFLYDEQLINQANPVTIDVKNKPLDKVLIECFASQPFTYVIKNDNVIITGRNKVIPGQVSAPVVITVTGQVNDEKGLPLPGVSIKVKGTALGTVTGTDGKYTISGVSTDAVLVFSFIGYASKEMTVAGQTSINISLLPSDNTLNDVVVVGYGTQKKGAITGSIATVKTEAITIAPVASTINALAGQLPGLIYQQSSGQPGADQASISIRGYGQAIWIVDGVESNFNNIDPNQIESLSVLKDAAASIYGSRAGNGVILVTTKRGKLGKPEITYNSSYTLQGNTYMANPVSSGNYAILQNEMYTNQGKPAPYTQDQIDKYNTGNDPAYPNTDWKKVAIRDWAPQNQQNLSVRGGTDAVKYYGFFGYTNQGSMWKNNGGGYKRYNFQSNIDAKISDDLSIQVTISDVNELTSQAQRGQGAGINGLWQDLWNSLPIYPATLPDPKFNSYANGAGVGSIALSSNEDIFGYINTNNQNLKGAFSTEYKIRAVEGLSVKGFIDYDQTYNNYKNFAKPYSSYTYDYTTKAYTLQTTLLPQAQLALDESQARNIDGQLSINYDHVFNHDHHVTALVLYEATDYSSNDLSAARTNFLTDEISQLSAGAVQTATNNSSAAQSGRTSYVGRLNYDYKGKYLLQSSLRADASSVFPSDKRWGYFPSVLIGWNLNKEHFLENSKNVDELKFRASYGASGLDNVGAYQYLTNYAIGGQYLFGTTTTAGIATTGLANPYLTWETVKLYNVGTDFSFFKRKLFGTLDVSYRTLSGIPATLIASLPSTFGAALPQVNINSQNNRAFELSLGTSGNVGQLSYTVTGNINWARTKNGHVEEPTYTDPDQKRVYQHAGQWADVVPL